MNIINDLNEPLDSHSTDDNFNEVMPKDITMIVCVRAHEGNPWVLDRIKMMGRYYHPAPAYLIVDFGSKPAFAEKIKDICKSEGYTYLHVADYDAYSPAAAHNRGFEASTTPFVFFCDADFISSRTLFGDLSSLASSLQLYNEIDIVLNLPAYHLNKELSSDFERQSDPEAQSRELTRVAYKANFLPYSREDNLFVAPYSNVYLINRKMYLLSGGYDERFRGHGSEDFEFLIRLAMHVGHLPLPNNVRRDIYGPLREDFFDHKPYEGFRRLLELASQPAINFGLKTFHLWHPREKADEWYANNDWKRTKFQEALDGYIENPSNLLGVDFLQRKGRIACLCKNPDHWGYFIALRLAGYETVPFFDDSASTNSKVSRGLTSGEFDGLAIFNPYMKSHSKFLETVILARELKKKVIVIERGALPSTIYYDTDVSYSAPSYDESVFLREELTHYELASTKAYVAELRAGNQTLEAMDSYEETKDRHYALQNIKAAKCFIPLQLDDDMAVTMFKKGKQSYPDFVNSLARIVENNPEVIFIVKPHPLSKRDALPSQPNLIIADRRDNIHYLLDASDVTLCYNSGVGLLSIIHEKPTITLGNAFYNFSGAAYRAQSAEEGLQSYLAGKVKAPRLELVYKIVGWLLNRRYSQFIASDNIREFSNRKAHGYKDISVTKLRLDDVTYKAGRQKSLAPFSWESFAAASISAQSPDNETDVGADNSSAADLLRWAKADFKARNFEKAGQLFERAFQADPSRPNFLRYSAEAYLKARDKQAAKSALTRAVKLMPQNQNARLRLLVVKFPILRFIFGARAMKIPGC